MEFDEARAQTNSEMRFITLELMKLALRRKVPFGKIASEFVKNVYSLEQQIRAPKRTRARNALKAGAGNKR